MMLLMMGNPTAHTLDITGDALRDVGVIVPFFMQSDDSPLLTNAEMTMRCGWRVEERRWRRGRRDSGRGGGGCSGRGCLLCLMFLLFATLQTYVRAVAGLRDEARAEAALLLCSDSKQEQTGATENGPDKHGV